MTYLKIIFVVFILIGGTSAVNAQNRSKKEITLENIKALQKERLTQNIILSLSNDIYLGRGINHKNIEYTKLFIENVLLSQKITPYGKTFRIPFIVKDSLKSDILVAYIDNKAPQKTIIINANYDNMGVVHDNGNPNADSIYNGANDNATGVAALIQIATAFKRLKLNYNLMICFTSGKHYAMCGAGYLADTLKYFNIKPIMALNFEMLGKKVHDTSQVYILSDELSNFRTLINKNLGEEFLIPIDSSENDSQNEKSEHTPFKNIFHIPSHTLTTFDYQNDENYLSPKDDTENIDLENTHLLINKITYGLYKLLLNDEKILYKGSIE